MLHLAAADEADLSILSAQMQDALLRREDLHFDAKRRRFVLAANRFAWDATPEKQRRRAALRFDDVTGVQAQGLKAAAADSVLSLLSVSFSMGDAPSGVISLAFSGQITIRLSVACINAVLDDLGPAWSAATTPVHGA